jgi:MoxR-like ATPase
MTKSNGFLRFAGTPGYIASGPLVDAVNCAIALERPLLIKGEPGTGKTVLARHVADGLGMPMISWHIKSTSKAADGLYVYDTVQRLNDSRFGTGDVSDIRRYIKLGPLGEAFAAPERRVLLIDEIDKADLEFPNDLLRELDEMRFSVLETGDKLLAQVPLESYWLRDQQELRKKPSTSELVDWISALLKAGVTTAQIEAHIPFLGALLKKEQDVDALQRYDERSGKYPQRWADLGPRYNQ